MSYSKMRSATERKGTKRDRPNPTHFSLSLAIHHHLLMHHHHHSTPHLDILTLPLRPHAHALPAPLPHLQQLPLTPPSNLPSPFLFQTATLLPTLEQFSVSTTSLSSFPNLSSPSSPPSSSISSNLPNFPLPPKATRAAHWVAEGTARRTG
jgi:hypothetical protein